MRSTPADVHSSGGSSTLTTDDSSTLTTEDSSTLTTEDSSIWTLSVYQYCTLNVITIDISDSIRTHQDENYGHQTVTYRFDLQDVAISLFGGLPLRASRQNKKRRLLYQRDDDNDTYIYI